MKGRIQSEKIEQAILEGYKFSQLWSVHNRVVSSNEVTNSVGALLKGTVYVDWAFWTDPNIVTHNFVVTLSNGNELSQANFEDLHSALGIVTPPVLTTSGTSFEVKISGWDNPSPETVASTVGVTGIYVIFIDNNDWIKVYDNTQESPSGTHLFNVRPNTDFRIMFAEGNDYEETTFELDGPFPLHQKTLRTDFKGKECRITMPTVGSCQAVMSGGTFGKIFIKYI